MNIEAIQTMIDTFKRLHKAPLPEHPDKGFNMADADFIATAYTQHGCGTAACMIGWGKIIFHDYWSLVDTLKISVPLSDALSIPSELYGGCRYHYEFDSEKFTLPAAIRVLQILRDTGEVRWNEAIDNPWMPESEVLKFSTDDWLNSMIDPTVDVAIPLLEGPKKEAVQ